LKKIKPGIGSSFRMKEHAECAKPDSSNGIPAKGYFHFDHGGVRCLSPPIRAYNALRGIVSSQKRTCPGSWSDQWISSHRC